MPVRHLLLMPTQIPSGAKTKNRLEPALAQNRTYCNDSICERTFFLEATIWILPLIGHSGYSRPPLD